MGDADETSEPPRKQLKMSTPASPAASSSSAPSPHPFSALAHSPNGSRISLESALKVKKSGPSYGMDGVRASSSGGSLAGKAPKKLVLKTTRGQHYHPTRSRSIGYLVMARCSRTLVLIYVNLQLVQMVPARLKTLSMLRFRH